MMPHQSPIPTETDHSPEGLVIALEKMAGSDKTIWQRIEHFGANEILLHEGAPNPYLFVVLHGRLALFKQRPDGSDVLVSEHGSGDLLGINSYATKKNSFCSAKSLTPIRILRLDEPFFEGLRSRLPELAKLIDHLIAVNLASRYRKATRLQMELSEANLEITETRNRLIHQEKLATLGQLVAGLAHELNNPVAAMLRECEHLSSTLDALLDSVLPSQTSRAYLNAGKTSNPLVHLDTRRALEELERHHPTLKRSLLRRIVRLPEELRDALLNGISKDQNSPESQALLEIFDAGLLLQALQVSARQVSHLIEGLKRYSRPADSAHEEMDLKESLGNSMVILGNLLKRHEIEVEISEKMLVLARAGDLGQIWTNLIKNACEAMHPPGKLRIVGLSDENNHEIRIVDHGPGIPPEIRNRIFELNFTTKTGAENFGLGLGLSITRSLIAGMGGKLTLEETPGGGATFVVVLPASKVSRL